MKEPADSGENEKPKSPERLSSKHAAFLFPLKFQVQGFTFKGNLLECLGLLGARPSGGLRWAEVFVPPGHR
jgi:hypothetical protein